jgi:integrase
VPWCHQAKQPKSDSSVQTAERRAADAGILTPKEVEKLVDTARRHGRYGQRDATLILVAYRHGLRATEIADLEWSQVERGRGAALHVRRAKNGKPAVHPIRGDELRMLRELQRNTESAFASAAGRSPRTLSIAL